MPAQAQFRPRFAAPLAVVATRAFGAVAYLSLFATCAALFAFLADFGLPVTVDRGRSTPLGAALAINLSLIALFGLQHSVMARPTFKQWWTRHIPSAIERSTYIVTANLVLLLLFWQWRPIPHVIWEVNHLGGMAALYGLYGLGWGVMFLSTFLLDHPELAGLRQTGLAPAKPGAAFRTPFLYQLVRHPMMLGWLILFWATPRMTAGHLLLAIAVTVYVRIALHFEERNLVDAFGDAYRRYQREVPGLVPRVGRGSATSTRARR